MGVFVVAGEHCVLLRVVENCPLPKQEVGC